jgi:hypothetical protein
MSLLSPTQRNGPRITAGEKKLSPTVSPWHGKAAHCWRAAALSGRLVRAAHESRIGMDVWGISRVRMDADIRTATRMADGGDKSGPQSTPRCRNSDLVMGLAPSEQPPRAPGGAIHVRETKATGEPPD